MKTICMHPFKSIAVLPSGNTAPCCAFMGGLGRLDDIDDLSSHFYQGDEYSNLRQLELSDQWHSGCAACKRFEALNIPSRKNLFNTQREINFDVNLTHLDLTFGNTCNLTCAMCSSEWSSKWFELDTVFGKPWRPVSDISTLSYDSIDKIVDAIVRNKSSIELIEIKGGEPLYDKRFHYFLEKIQVVAENIKLLLVTNFTTINQRLCDKLTSLGQLELVLSIDGIGKMYDWVRGFDFEALHEKLKIFLPQFNSITNTITVNYTTSVYNANHLLPFSDWLNNFCDTHKMNNVNLSFNTFVRHPVYMSPLIINDRSESLKQLHILKTRKNSAALFLPSILRLESYLNQATIKDKTILERHDEFHAFLVQQRGFDIKCI